MKILDKYISRQLICMVLIVSLVLLGVDLFFYLVKELRFTGKGDYTLGTALVFVFLTIPRKIYIIFPWAALIGTLLSLGQLAKNSELVVVRSAAVSINRISVAVFKGAVLLTIIVTIFGEVISPASERLAQQKKTRALSQGQTIRTDYGIWVRNKGEFIHIKTILANGELKQVTRYIFNNDLVLQEIIFAEKAYQTGDGWKLQNIKGTKFLEDQTVKIEQEELFLPVLLDKEILETSSVKHLDRLSLLQLQRVIQNRKTNGLNVTDYLIAFWAKVLQPFCILVMVYLAIPFVFGPLRSTSMGLKLLIGVLIGFSFYVVNAICSQLPTIINLSPVLAIVIPIFVFFIWGVVMMARVR